MSSRSQQNLTYLGILGKLLWYLIWVHNQFYPPSNGVCLDLLQTSWRWAPHHCQSCGTHLMTFIFHSETLSPNASMLQALSLQALLFPQDSSSTHATFWANKFGENIPFYHTSFHKYLLLMALSWPLGQQWFENRVMVTAYNAFTV